MFHLGVGISVVWNLLIEIFTIHFQPNKVWIFHKKLYFWNFSCYASQKIHQRAGFDSFKLILHKTFKEIFKFFSMRNWKTHFHHLWIYCRSKKRFWDSKQANQVLISRFEVWKGWKFSWFVSEKIDLETLFQINDKCIWSL